ncbi:MAG: class I SAM-dependent methyltransferase [Deltaproteobacteria bacterium]|nr:MAG: class I SAM-dependent methyltransferase [Deltaproteobacteria bacterium]
MDILAYNKKAWDAQVDDKNKWTEPVSSEVIQQARNGQWSIVLTPTVPVPGDWYPPLQGCDVLCMASGGGQQGPVLAAAGASVTVLDNSPKQLAQDRMVAERDGLHLTLLEGDMANMHTLKDESFDLIVNPVSNCFVPDVQPVWNESYRVLRRGGHLLTGICNPALFALDRDLEELGVLQIKHSIPYCDLTSLTKEERKRILRPNDPIEFGHSLEAQLGGLIRAGFALTGLYEDAGGGYPLNRYLPSFMAIKATKL